MKSIKSLSQDFKSFFQINFEVFENTTKICLNIFSTVLSSNFFIADFLKQSKPQLPRLETQIESHIYIYIQGLSFYVIYQSLCNSEVSDKNHRLNYLVASS